MDFTISGRVTSSLFVLTRYAAVPVWSASIPFVNVGLKKSGIYKWWVYTGPE